VLPANDQEVPIAFVSAFGRGSSLYLSDKQSPYNIDLAQIEASTHYQLLKQLMRPARRLIPTALASFQV
jgi:hypothetical protein